MKKTRIFVVGIIGIILGFVIGMSSSTSYTIHRDKEKFKMVTAASNLSFVVNPMCCRFANATQKQGINKYTFYMDFDFPQCKEATSLLTGIVRQEATVDLSGKKKPIIRGGFSGGAYPELVTSTKQELFKSEKAYSIDEASGEIVTAYMGFKDEISLTEYVDKYYKQYFYRHSPNKISGNLSGFLNGTAIRTSDDDSCTALFLRGNDVDYDLKQTGNVFPQIEDFDSSLEVAGLELGVIKHAIYECTLDPKHMKKITNSKFLGDLKVDFDSSIKYLNGKEPNDVKVLGMVVTARKELIKENFAKDPNIKFVKLNTYSYSD